MTAMQPTSTDVRPLSVWAINGLIDFARASHIAVEEDASIHLFEIEAQLWSLMVRRPIQTAVEARGKLDALVTDLERCDELDARSATIIRQVMAWLDSQ